MEQYDLSKTSDYEIAKLIARRDCYQYSVEVIDQLLNKIGEAKGLVDTTKTPPHQTTNQSSQSVTEPNQTTQDLDKLPWRSYKSKQAATPDESAWLFGNTKGAEKLLENLKANDGKVKLGTFEYSISGQEKQFIARNPVKQERSV